MTKVYDKLNQMYPELNGLENTFTSKKDEETNNTEKSSPQSSQTHLSSDLSARIKSVSKEIKLSPFKDNKWIRSLNKIISPIVTGFKNTGACFVFVGASAKVGTSTVCYWTARILASTDHKQHCLYLTLTPKSKQPKVDIIDDLIHSRYSVPQLVDHLPQSNFNHFNLTLSPNHLHAPSTPGVIASILNEAKKNYRWIIIDAPPFFSVPGIYTLASDTDGVILVAKARSTRIPTLNAISEDIEESGAKLLGVILNQRVFPLPNFLMKFF